MKNKSAPKPNHRAVLTNSGPTPAPAAAPQPVRVRVRQRFRMDGEAHDVGAILELHPDRALTLGNLVTTL